MGITLAGCAPAPEPEAIDEEALDAVYATAEITTDVQEKWARSCALCHVAGEGAAPRMGDMETWQPRIEQGSARLLHNTIVGLNRMPPLGYCMDCETEDFAAMIKMMTGDTQ